MIYLDNAATTAMYNELNDIIREYNSNNFFNMSSNFKAALKVKDEVNKARRKLSEILGVSEGCVYFTSGATESDNWAIFSGYKNKKSTVIASAGEHSAVYNALINLQNKGADIKFIPLQKDGRIDGEKLLASVNSDTGFVSIIDINNETGADNNVADLAREIKKINNKVIVHSDGVQAFCRKNILKDNIDLYSVSAHKVHGPKGVGALFVREGLNLSPFIFGGGQEKNYRSGTENVSGIIAFAKAAEKCAKEYDKNYIGRLKKEMFQLLSGSLIIKQNGDFQTSSPHILAVSIEGVMGETLLHALEEREIYIGLGSACSSNSKGNRILHAMNLDKKSINSNIRLSFDMSNTVEEITKAADNIIELSQKIKSKNIY